MLTGELRSQIDAIWNSFWSGGISNPMEVMEQITYLLFMRRLDELQQGMENRRTTLGVAIDKPVFPKGKDPKGRPYADLRWSRFKDLEPREMFDVVADHVFPFLRDMGADGSSYSVHMANARFTIPAPALLAKVVDAIAAIPMDDRDAKGDLYEYMLGKIASAGQNGQFRTPRHIIRLMVELTAPTAKDVICDPAAGTCGFLVAAGEYLRHRHPEILRSAKSREHFHHRMFHGYDFDHTMLRIGSMNMALHGVEGPDIRYRDSLAQEHSDDAEAYTLILANPPFAGSLDYEATAKDLQAIVNRTPVPRPVPALAEARRPRRGDRARRRAVRQQQGAQGTAAPARRRPQARRRDLAALGRVQAVCRREHRDPRLHQDQQWRHRPGVVLRPASRRLEPRRQATAAAQRRQARPGARRCTERSRARQEQPPRRTPPLAHLEPTPSLACGRGPR